MRRFIGLALVLVPLAPFHAGSGVHGQETSAAAAEPRASRAYSDETYEAVLRFYGYDGEMPLDARVLEREEDALQVREKVVFNGVRDSRVPAYLGLPKQGSGPHPVILLIDGIMGSKERWWEEDSWPRGKTATDAFLSAGFAVFALDAKYHGERIARKERARRRRPCTGPSGYRSTRCCGPCPPATSTARPWRCGSRSSTRPASARSP